ncbi:helix-hairpin-helix domain-containing protein [Streptomyces katsurahamanus]|uniref:DNA helicase RecD n=1 Tax=Streptomyces katsurahamanus TaxID=2577098 RepID=A0ABW9NUQ9_9ACTN|nr:helix-hairpin-helix domain-containing protein [Streptomyces katsurahamanus]MQS36899.1 DNA helicase RecD [Streptomyces katsurahamanus]
MSAPSRGPNPEPPATADRDPEATEATGAPDAPPPPDGGPAAEAGPGEAEVSLGVQDPADAEASGGAVPGGPGVPGVPGDDAVPVAASEASGGESSGEPSPESSGGAEASAVVDSGAADTAADSDTDPGSDPDTDTDGSADPDADTDTDAGAATDTGTATGNDASGPSEAAAELAAQRELRQRIEQRKAERDGPIASGAKLDGRAADLLAAVRAVESGERPGTAFFDSPAPAQRASRPQPEPAPHPAVPAGTARPRETGPRTAVEHPAVPAPASAPETLAAVRETLGAGGAPESLAPRVAEVLGEGAAGILREDPWQLLSVPGVGPEQADGFARALLGGGCGPGDERRTAALVVWELERAASRGHTALAASAVREALAGRSVPDPDDALQRAIDDGVVLAFEDGAGEALEPAPEVSGETDETGEPDQTEEEQPQAPLLLGLDRYALAEESLADGLARLARSGADARWEGAAGPAELVRAVAESALATHTGGETARAEPVALAGAAGSLGLRAVVAVHSERARGALGPAAVTVAGLLTGGQGPGRDADGALALDLLVVLDAQLLDVESATALVESLPDGGRLVLSGDPGQLGPAGAGRVFGDLLAARVCPQIVSRTPDPGPIGELVSGVGVGELGRVAAPGKEVVIVPVRDAAEAVHRTVQLVADSVPRAIGVPAEQTQVITVGHGGAAGTRALNAALKQRLNPGPGRFGGFDPGDRIACTTAPGRTLPGTVVSADAEGLHLDCEGTRVTVPKERVGSALRHGWALTAHQASGMRWPAAVVVLPGDAAPGLSRPWVYTAFGRGERHLSVVHGVDQALPRAVAEIPAQERTTRLRSLLEGLLAPVG